MAIFTEGIDEELDQDGPDLDQDAQGLDQDVPDDDGDVESEAEADGGNWINTPLNKYSL